MKPCKIWEKSVNSSGYPRGSVGGKVRLIHSHVCEQVNGPRPEGHQASHICGVKRCVEETHLVWETWAENNARRSSENKGNGGRAASRVNRGKGRGWRLRSNTPGKPYLAEARLNGKLKSLGGYRTAEEAEKAYQDFWTEHRDD